MINYYDEIKNELINHEIYVKVKDYSKKRHELEAYYNVGKLLVEAQGGEKRAKYGDGLIKEYSKKLTKELGKGYTPTSLKRMRKFYETIQKGATMSHLSWSHYVELIKINDINKINYYIKICENYNLSIRYLREKIKLNEYERLSSLKEKVNNNEVDVGDYIKNPIIIHSGYKYAKISEKILKSLILEDIDFFLKELGEFFCYIGNEYRLKIGSRYNYIDLLLFNIKYNCYCVVELKISELKKEHIGQIEVYMNYIDKNIKTFLQNKTIGIMNL